MFTKSISEAELDWIAERNVMLPRAHAADLLYEHCLNDWSDVIRSITLPTLVVGAEASIFSAPSQRWIAGQNPNAKVEIFEGSEGGSHFMFAENPERFNRVVGAFLAK
jgi:pimeloyl-ACP methyl ester carboxylesterase